MRGVHHTCRRSGFSARGVTGVTRLVELHKNRCGALRGVGEGIHLYGEHDRCTYRLICVFVRVEYPRADSFGPSTYLVVLMQ